MAGCFIVRKTDGVVSHEILGGYETRNESTLWCIQQADAIYHWSDFKDLFIHTGDFEYQSNEYTYSKHDSYHLLVPDFNFHAWPQVGIDDYETFVQKIDEAGTSPALVNKVGWIGNTNTKEVRKQLLGIGESNPDVCDIMDCGNWWKNPDSIQLNSQQYMSTPDLVKTYSMVLDIEGTGYSGRLKHLLWSHRPLLLVDRPHKEFFFKYLNEWEHYIPVKRDLSDLLIQIKWCLVNTERAQKIAENAYRFSQKYLTRAACFKEWNKIITKHSS